MEDFDLPTSGIPFNLLDGVFARLDRQVGEDLHPIFFPYSSASSDLGMDDCQSQSWVSLLLANGRKDPDPAISVSREIGLFQITFVVYRTSMRCSPFTEVTSIFVGNGMISISRQAIDAGSNHEMSSNLLSRAEQFIDVAFAVADMDAPSRIDEKFGGLFCVLNIGCSLSSRWEPASD